MGRTFLSGRFRTDKNVRATKPLKLFLHTVRDNSSWTLILNGKHLSWEAGVVAGQSRQSVGGRELGTLGFCLVRTAERPAVRTER